MDTHTPSGPRRQEQSHGRKRHHKQGKNRRPNSNGNRQNTGHNDSYNSRQENQGQRQQQQPRNSHGRQRNQQNGPGHQQNHGQQRNGNQHRQGQQQRSQSHHQGNHRERNSNRQNQNQQHRQHPHQQHPPNMWQYNDEDELDWETEESDSNTSDDEVLEDAPPLEPAQQNLDLNAMVERWRGFVGTKLDRSRQQAGSGDRTMQAWLQQQQQQLRQLQQILGGGPERRAPRKRNRQQQECQDECCRPSYTDSQWAQDHIIMCAAATLDWEIGQRRRLEEQAEAIYNLNHEAVKVLSLLEQAHKLEQQQQPHQPPPPAQPFAHFQQPFRFSPPAPPPQQPPPQPNPAVPPAQLTHSQKLETLLRYHSDLKTAVQKSKDLVTSLETTLARNENRIHRRAAISTFFTPLARTLGRAESRLRAYHGAAQRREAHGGHFLWVGADETAFCAAWENVVGLYREVVVAEERLVASQGRAEWDVYNGMLGAFADGVKGFDERFLGRGGFGA